MNNLKAHCPKCKSDNIELRTRKRFLINAAVCFAIVLLICLMFKDIKDMDFEPPTSWALPFVFLGFLFALIRGFYWLIKGGLIKEASFKCGYCNNVFKNPFMQSRTEVDSFNTIKKLKVKNK